MPTRAARKSDGNTRIAAPRALTIHVQIAGSAPLIWRRVRVENDITLLELHHVLQAAMGWTDAHLHEFKIGGHVFASPDEDEPDEREVIDEGLVPLRDVLKVGTRFDYVYDFGDYWVHQIEVEQSKRLSQPTGTAYVIEGARACPPEDCGGIHGYGEFLETLARNPHDEEVTGFLRWAGEDFDPRVFERRSANAALMRMAWNGWGKTHRRS